jgi:xanthine dehydrogenase YagS FAD-binding subunit
MKDYTKTPSQLISIKSIPNLGKIEWTKDGAKIGALVTLSHLAEDGEMQKRFPALVQAMHLTAMPQIRNAATIGGNLCQRPRCWYYRDEHTHCLKKGGSRCFAVEGENQYHAILGGQPCFIVHPSDPAPVLMALGASVVISDGKTERTVSLDDFFVPPSENLYRENILKQNELITHVVVPYSPANTKSFYVKEREKDSYDWALASAAVVATTGAGGQIEAVRIVLGGVAPIPWRARDAEAALIGKTMSEPTIQAAAVASVNGAKPMTKNGYKVPLTQAVVKRALMHIV